MSAVPSPPRPPDYTRCERVSDPAAVEQPFGSAETLLVHKLAARSGTRTFRRSTFLRTSGAEEADLVSILWAIVVILVVLWLLGLLLNIAGGFIHILLIIAIIVILYNLLVGRRTV